MLELPPLPERYVAREIVGEGATGVVYRAEDRLLGVDVAIKLVHAHLAVHPRFRARFAREVSLSASVSHRRVVPVHDYGRLANGRPFVVLAYADRGSLAELLRTRPPLGDAMRIIEQVLEALGALHSRGLVHQDLKPENVLLYSNVAGHADAWVADLGVAGAMSELAMDRRGIAGTPAWMAPEQIAGRVQELGPWTDLYAVGLLLYEMLGGHPAASHDSLPQGQRRVVRPVRLADEVPPGLSEVVEILLDPDPRQRYDRASDVIRALQAALHDVDPTLVAWGPADAWGTTTFPDIILPEARDPLVVPHHPPVSMENAPRWNRVPPGPMPRQPPPEEGVDARARASLGLFALREPPLVAREALRRQLWLRARQVVRYGEPLVVLMIGRAGSGKSRIVESVARSLDEAGYMEAFYLRYHAPAEADDGYRGAVREILAPWNDTRFEAVRRLARWLARDQQTTPDAVASEAAVLTRWCGYVGAGEQSVNAAVGLAFLYRHLDARAWRGGACLVLEDAHLSRAEGDGLAICEALLERAVGERPILAMATLSSEAIEADPDLAGQVAALERLGAIRLDAQRFSVSEMRQLLSDALQLEPDLAIELAPLCSGSPTIAMLLLRNWAARGLLERSPGRRFALRQGIDVQDQVPDTLDALCEQRIRGALAASEDPGATAEALAATALAGQEPLVQVVREVNLEGLDRLLATGLVRQSGRRLAFEHSGVHRIAVQLARERADVADLHRRLADAWEKLGRYTGVDVDLPHGLHRLHSGNADRAVAPLLRVSRNALAEGRATIAAESARHAAAAADLSGVLMAQVEARQRLAEALLELDRAEEARIVLEQAASLGHIDRLTLARIQVVGARAAIALGDLEDGRNLLNKAAPTFEATRDRAGMIDTAHGQGTLYRIEGRPDAAADRYARMLRLNKGADPRTEVLGLVGLVESRLAAGQVAGSDQYLERLREVARQSGDTRNIAQATYTAGLVQLRRHRLDLAERYFQTGRALAATLGADRLRHVCENNLGEVARYRGDLRGAESAYERAARLAEARGWHAQGAVARINLAQLNLQKGAAAIARVEIDRADRLLQKHPGHWGWLVVGLFRALWAAEDGDERTCRAWWAVANERGLGHMRSPDLWLPLERLSTAASLQGWRKIAKRASTLARQVMESGVNSEAEVSIEE